MSAHTPGPWRADHISKIDGWVVKSLGETYTIAECGIKIGSAAEANARLIAAAPSMYTALREIANGDGVYGMQAREYKDIARAALAKVQP